MRSETAAVLQTIDWAVASRELPGETVCGDRHTVTPAADGVLASVVDGVGHGQEACLAAGTACMILEEHVEWPLEVLMHRCHEALKKTRGAVMTLARLNILVNEITWLGIGNVEAVLWRANSGTHTAPERVLLHSGLLGLRLPQLQTNTLPIGPGDLLVIVTDGIAPEFHETMVRSDSPQQIA